MKIKITGLILTVLACVCLAVQGQKPVTSAHTRYVNTLIGTTPLYDSAIVGFRVPEGWRPWSGLVFPGSSLPNAMVQLSPVTMYGSGAGYQYEDSVIYGFTHTNKGHWNLCNIPVLPVAGNVATNNSYHSTYSHNNETATAGYYQVYLNDYKINVELTSTLRCGFHKYLFADDHKRQVLFDLAKANNRVINWSIEQVGPSAVQGFQELRDEKVFFFAKVNTPILRLEKVAEGKREGRAMIHMRDGSETVELRIGLSYVSSENAKANLDAEISNKSFDEVRKEANDTWEALLSKIDVNGGTQKQRQLFYSSLYRSFLWPVLRSDRNGQYTDANKKVVTADFNYYTVPSLWDTYRNKLVLLGIINPKVTSDVIKSLKDMGDKTGFIPTFFHGDHAAAFIAGSYARGINDFDVKGTYKLLLRNAFVEGPSRPYLNEYMEKGFISDPAVDSPWVETKARAGVAKTLEYAFDDYALAQLAKKLGDTTNYNKLMARSTNYRNVFDPSTKFMRGKLANGSWIQNFNPQYPYYEYMYREANAWQVSFFVPHDMKSLLNLYGGPGAFEDKLDSFFTVPWNPHYIARNVESMIGQYCHGNQPDHEAPFSYYFINKPWKSQAIIDRILQTLYGIGPEGLALCGMDDAGEMSSWYVFTSLGLYPFTSADARYIVSVPVFNSIYWKTPTGKKVVIRKTGSSRHLDKIYVNDKPVNRYFISHDLFRDGGSIIIKTK
ncbi:MAG: GH92 family glycosyl hydrolase [Candidatus Dadabacteria bacterium]